MKKNPIQEIDDAIKKSFEQLELKQAKAKKKSGGKNKAKK